MANVFKQLRSLIPQDVTQVGSVVSSSLDGTSLINLVGGGEVRVAGTGFSNGTPVFIRGGRIVSQAPSLTEIPIDV
jgi:hypothetical protein